MARISWHPAFVQALQHELIDYRDILSFESEHQLLTEPLRIDVLIIKKKKDIVIEKNIARIFRQFNIVEYKSPEDRVTIEAYHIPTIRLKRHEIALCEPCTSSRLCG